MVSLSPRQAQILSFIVSRVQEKGYPPSVREIGDHVGLSSPASVHAHLVALENKGVIRKNPLKPRTIEIVDPSIAEYRDGTMVDVPVVSKIEVGMPITKYLEGYYKLHPSMVGTDSTHYLLKVQGEHLKDVSILNNDFVIVRQQNHGRRGDIVIAAKDHEGIVKKYTDSDRVLGKVIGVIRLFQ